MLQLCLYFLFPRSTGESGSLKTHSAYPHFAAGACSPGSSPLLLRGLGSAGSRVPGKTETSVGVP